MQIPSRKDLKRYLDDGTGVVLIALLLSAAMAENLYAVSQVMDNTLSMGVQFVVAAACVLIEAFGFVKARQCWRTRRWGACALISVATVLAIANSAANEATFYNVNFANKAQSLANDVTSSRDTAKEKQEIEARLAKTADLRPVGAIEADIAAALAKPVRGDRRARSLDQLTKGCTSTRNWAYDQCRPVLALRGELSSALELTPQVTKDRERLEVIRASGTWLTTVGVVRPGATIIADIINGIRSSVWRVPEARYVSAESVQTVLIVLIMAALQFFNIALPFAWFGNTGRSAQSTVSKPANDGFVKIVDRSVDRPLNDNAYWSTACCIIDRQSLADWLAKAMVDKKAFEPVDRNCDDLPVDQPKEHDPAAVSQSISTPCPTKTVDRTVNDAVVAVKTFVDQYTEPGDEELSDDMASAYAASPQGKWRELHANHLTRIIRKITGTPRDETHRDRKGARTVKGIRLNEAGKRLLEQSQSPGRGDEPALLAMSS